MCIRRKRDKILRLFDLHCDTAYEMYKRNCGITQNGLHISLDREDKIEEYIQLTAIWCDENCSDEECYNDFFAILDHFKNENKGNKWKTILTIEDARLLCGRIDRLNTLFKYGVKVLTPLWKGSTIIGGAYNTDDGLTTFGKEVVSRCFALGIVPDISHASLKSADDMFLIAEKEEKPLIASHSCSFSIYPHERNLNDEQFKRIKSLGGIVGLSFCSYHLTDDKKSTCTTDDILKHIEHYLYLGEDNVCIGADMDGAPLPEDIRGIEDIPVLYDRLCECFGIETTNKITWENAHNFFKRIILI